MTDSERLRQYSAHFADYDVNISMELRRIADKLEHNPAMSAEDVFDTQTKFNKWLTELTKDEANHIISMMKDYAAQFSLVVPSDEEIETYFNPNPKDFRTTYERDRIESAIIGAKWAISQILKNNG
jgi:hypothetical protein